MTGECFPDRRQNPVPISQEILTKGTSNGALTLAVCFLRYSFLRNCFACEPIRTRSPTFLIPISLRTFWSMSIRFSPVMLFAGRCQNTLQLQRVFCGAIEPRVPRNTSTYCPAFILRSQSPTLRSSQRLCHVSHPAPYLDHHLRFHVPHIISITVCLGELAVGGAGVYGAIARGAVFCLRSITGAGHFWFREAGCGDCHGEGGKRVWYQGRSRK